MKIRHAFSALIPIAMGLVASAAHAQAESKVSYFCEYENQAPIWTNECTGAVLAHRITVSIRPSAADAGRPGSYYIGMRSNGDIKGIFSDGKWVAMQGGMFPPAGSTASMSSGPVSFQVLNNVHICQLAGAGDLELWAGYGVLDVESERKVEFFHKSANPNHTPEYMRQVYIQNDLQRGEKGWNVLKFNCQDSSNSIG